MKSKFIHNATLLIASLLLVAAVAQAQQQTASANSIDGNAATDAEFRFTNLLAQERAARRAGFSLMPSSVVNASSPRFTIAPMAAGPTLPVAGSGTMGRLTKWTGFTSSNSFIGNSTIFEDKFGLVGIGTDTPTSRLTVAGIIQSTFGGFKFPDGTIQTTASLPPGPVVKSLNGLTGPVTLAAGPNITITPSGNTLTIASSVANPALSAFQATLVLELNQGDFSAIGTVVTVPVNKRLVIEYVTIEAGTIEGFIRECTLNTVVNGITVNHRIVLTRDPDDDQSPSYATDKQVRIYADGGTNVQFFVRRSSDQSIAVGQITISGHLVDIP